MDLRKLEAFRAVARQGGLRQAASSMRRTVPAISMQIKSLEEEIGIRLFHHLPTKLVLTEQGQMFLQELDGVFEALERAKSVASLPPRQFTGSLSVAIGNDLSTFFAPSIATFARAFPNVRISLISGPTWRSLPLVIEQEADVGLGFYRGVPASLHKIPVMETGISLVVPTGMGLSRKSKPTLEWIAAQRIIMLSRTAETRRMIDAVFASKGHVLGNVIDVSSCRSALEFVCLGLGIGLVHQVCTCTEGANDTLRFDMDDEFGKLEVSLVTRQGVQLRPPHSAFIETVTSSSARKPLVFADERARDSV